MYIPGGASTATTSKISDGHRSHLPDHSNAQPGSPPHTGDGAVIEVSCVAGCTVWAFFGCTIVACAHTVVAVPKTQPQRDLGVAEASFTPLRPVYRVPITKKVR